VLSYQIDDALRAATLAIVLKELEPAPSPVSLVYARQGLMPLKLRTFLDFSTPWLGRRSRRARVVLPLVAQGRGAGIAQIFPELDE
jgi:DNA-binding transcriptional LysR family regulator